MIGCHPWLSQTLVTFRQMFDSAIFCTENNLRYFRAQKSDLHNLQNITHLVRVHLVRGYTVS